MLEEGHQFGDFLFGIVLTRHVVETHLGDRGLFGRGFQEFLQFAGSAEAVADTARRALHQPVEQKNHERPGQYPYQQCAPTTARGVGHGHFDAMLFQGGEQGVVAEVGNSGVEARALDITGLRRRPLIQAAIHFASVQQHFLDIIGRDFRLEGAVGHLVDGFTPQAPRLKGQIGEQHQDSDDGKGQPSHRSLRWCGFFGLFRHGVMARICGSHYAFMLDLTATIHQPSGNAVRV